MADRPPLRGYSHSRAVVMGTWKYAFLDRVPAAEHSLRRMAGLLTGPLCGWPRDRLLLVENEPSPGDLPDRLITAFDGISDVALFYFVGHGQISPDDQLCLGLVQSRPEPNRRAATSLRFSDVRQALQDGEAAVKIVILDCCFAGLATGRTGALAGRAGERVLDLTAGTGAYTMAATSAYATAWYQDDPELARPQTYFTKYLADLVEKGIPGQPSRVQLDALFKQLRENLAADQRPVPWSRAVNDAREFAFAYNAAPPEAQRDPDREIKDLTRRLAEAEARRIEAEAARARDLAEAEARERALRAEMAERNRQLERLHGQAHSSPPPADKQQRQLQDAIQAAELRLDEATTAHAAAAAQAAAASHVTAKPETVPAARPAPPSDTPPPATLSDAEIATPAPRNSAVDHKEQATADRQQLGHHKETGEDAPLVRVDNTQPSRGGNKKTQRRGIRPARLYSGIVGAIALAGLLAVSLLLATQSPKREPGTSTSSSSSSAGSSSSASSSSPSIAALSGTLNGSGSTFQLTFQQAAISSLRSIAPNLTVNYGGSGSGTGRTDLAAGTVNFAGSDELIPAAEQANFNGKTVLYFPVALGPITVSYNLSGLSKPLQLSAPVLAQIFEGNITTWNNPAIAADNPGVTLPSIPITIARRSDSSGTTQYFSEFLVEAAQGAWTLGSSPVIVWPTSRGGNGSGGVAQIIKSTPGAIGYVDYGDAKASGLTFASIKNKAGNYVMPSPTSASAAASQATVQPNLTFSAVWAPGASSYPITYQSWVLVYESQPNAQTAKNLQGYIGYLLGAGQQLLPSLGYAPLPPNIDQMAKAQLSKIVI